MSSQLETKATIAEMNEQLALKANKQSVANALHLKANCADIDVLLLQKPDIMQIENLRNIVKSKTDEIKFDQAVSQLLDIKPDKADV